MTIGIEAGDRKLITGLYASFMVSPFCPYCRIAQQDGGCYRVSRNALILSSCSGVARISKWKASKHPESS